MTNERCGKCGKPVHEHIAAIACDDERGLWATPSGVHPGGDAYRENLFRKGIRLDWTDKRLARITRLRLISDPWPYPTWDFSYCFGEDVDGNPCRVILPFNTLPKRGMRQAILEYAKEDGVYAKGLGIFDNISTFC